jgi:hypothetical protein
VTQHAAEDSAVIRTAALLNLTRPDSLAVLCGNESGVANRVSEMTQARVIALNPTTMVEETERVAIITCGSRIPLASGSVDAIAIGSDLHLVPDSERVLRPGSRITARSTVDLGDHFHTLASDDRNVVAESPTTLLSLRRNTSQ